MSIARGAALPGWVVWATGAAAVLFDWVVARSGAAFGWGPDPVLAAALVLAALGQLSQAYRVGLVGGFLADLAGGVLLGLGSATRVGATALAGYLMQRLEVESYPVVLALCTGAALAERAMSMVGAWLFGVVVPLSVPILAGQLVAAWLTGALFAVLYPLMAWLAWHGQRERRGTGSAL